MPIAVSVIISLIVVILCVIYLMAVTGKNRRTMRFIWLHMRTEYIVISSWEFCLLRFIFGFMDYTDFLDIIATEMS